MTSMPLIDPELLSILETQPPLELTASTLPALRLMFAGQVASAPVPQSEPVIVEHMQIAGPVGAPPVRLLAYRPLYEANLLPAILHIHGGGYMLGQPEMNDAENRHRCADLRCAIFSVEYRLAPETPHPGPLEDCYAALRYLHSHADGLRIDPARIGIMGESAGGGLAAALALLARDRGEFAIAFQHLIYPMLDDRTCVAADPHPFTGEFIWTRAYNLAGWSCLLGAAPGGENVSPYAAAARATDLSRLPPCYIATGALDLFLDENLEYARRLTRAGVPLELHVYPGAFHAFQLNPEARVTKAAASDSRAALRRGMYG
jgi:triacylglycerol lipase